MVVTRFFPHQCISQRAVRTIGLKGGPIAFPCWGPYQCFLGNVMIQGGGGIDPCSSSGSAHVECE